MIPAQAHFIWIGRRIPFAYVFALRSAAVNGQLERVVLHHTDPLDAGPELDLLTATSGVVLNQFDPSAWMHEVGSELGLGARLWQVYQGVENPVARSNILRAAIVHAEGGVYLDLDTVTITSLRPLLDATEFLGVEHVVWPHFVVRSRSPWLHAKSQALNVVRATCRRLPRGYRWFRPFAPLYYRAINGAVLGGVPRAPLMAAYLRSMTLVPQEKYRVKHALGTHLLQEQVELNADPSLTIHPPEVFYPLGPEISEHWFRVADEVDLDKVLHANTRVVHWYASVRTKHIMPSLSPEYVRDHAECQLYSALVRRYCGVV